MFSCNNSQTENNAKPASFIGEVIEKYEDSCLVEITENLHSSLRVSDLVVVKTNISNCPKYEIGDYLKIEFDGTIAESYPPQIFNTLHIEKLENNSSI